MAFNADVNAQAGAYATGILTMMVSGAIAVTITEKRRRNRSAAFGCVMLTFILLYALVSNIIDKPDGIAISGMFIAGIIALSVVSRVSRTTELRADAIEFDGAARRFIDDSLMKDGGINIIANQRQSADAQEYLDKEVAQRGMNPVPGNAGVLFLEIDVVDPSAFSQVLRVHGVDVDVDGHRVPRVESPTVPNAIAAVLLALRDATRQLPHCYFEWAEGNPLGHLFRYLLLGRGDTAPVVREILRKVEPDPARRPRVHVGG